MEKLESGIRNRGKQGNTESFLDILFKVASHLLQCQHLRYYQANVKEGN